MKNDTELFKAIVKFALLISAFAFIAGGKDHTFRDRVFDGGLAFLLTLNAALVLYIYE